MDGLPGPGVTAAGADKRYVVVQTDHGFYYFERTPYETKGWGAHPERMVGPLNADVFKDASERLGLPALSTQP